jgi:hypothetical protein
MSNVEFKNDGSRHKTDQLVYNDGKFGMDDKLDKDVIFFIDRELKNNGCEFSITDLLDEDGTPKTQADADKIHEILDDGNGKDDIWGEGDNSSKGCAKKLNDWMKKERNVQVGNGEIEGDTSQGQIGDCWLIAGMNSLNSSEKGRQKIKENLKWDDKGNATVLYNGTDYVIPKEVIDSYEEKGVKGDRDMLAIECAVREDRKRDGHKSEGTDDNGRLIEQDPLNGGNTSEFMMRFGSQERLDAEKTSDGVTTLKDMDKNELKDFIEESQNDPRGFNLSLYGNVKDNKLDNGAGHAYSVTSVDMEKEEIEYINPWDSTKRYKISFDDLLKMENSYIVNNNEGLKG